MEKGIKWLFLASVLTVTIMVILAEHYTPSFGQRRDTTRKTPCGCFCGDRKKPTYVVFDKTNCFGIISADACVNSARSLPEEQLKTFCDKVKAQAKVKSPASCPVLKTLVEYCKEQDKSGMKCEEPDSPWFGSPSDCKDLQSWQIAQTGRTVTLSICGHIIFSNPDVGTDRLFSRAYLGALKDHLRETVGEKVCCDSFREAVRTGTPCDPRKDVDCDGKPNSKDIANEFPDIGLSYRTAEGATIDPFPPGLNLSEIYPDKFSCKDCQWELVRGELKCSPDGKQQHVYQAKWRCPSSGVEADTFKYAPSTAPCKK